MIKTMKSIKLGEIKKKNNYGVLESLMYMRKMQIYITNNSYQKQRTDS